MEPDPVAWAEALGKRNAGILELATRWCRHVALDQSQSGYGVVQQLTGLPVSGGEFRCDYATLRSGSSMRLELSAVDFYAANCVGCENRDAADIPPHLGSYADGILAERTRREAKAAQARQRQAEDAVARRAARRALVTETRDTSFVLSLLDGLDQPETRADAARRLGEQTVIDPAPVAAALPALVDPASTPQDNAVIDALDKLDLAGLVADAEPIVSLALRAVTEGWGSAGGRVLARHAAAEHIGSEGLIQRLIFLAGPVSDRVMQEAPEAEPDALLAYVAIDAGKVAGILAAELRHGDDKRRACAASAAPRVLRDSPELVGALLPGVLDGLILADHGRPSMSHPTARLQECLALALTMEPGLVDGKVASRWANATAAYRERLLGGYQRMLGSDEDDGPVPPDGAVAAALSRASVVLTDGIVPLTDPLSREARDEHRTRAELQRTASEIISSAAELGGSAASLDVLLGIVMLLVQREQELESAPPAVPSDPAAAVIAPLDRTAQLRHFDYLIRKMTKALAARAGRDREHWWSLLDEAWESTDSSDPLRPRLLMAAALVAVGDLADLPRPVPYMFGSLTGPTVPLRAAALRGLGELAGHGLAVPGTVLETAWELRNDTKLAVIVVAVSAFPRLYRDSAPGAPRVLDLVIWLLFFAQVYSSDPERGDIVTDALDNAIGLSTGQSWEDQAWRASMAVIGGMYAYDAAHALIRICPWDSRPMSDWTDAAVSALRLDTRPEYGGLQDSDRDEILRPFLRVPREDLTTALKETTLGAVIAEIAKTYLPGRVLDAYAMADVLARGEAWSLAQEVADAVLAAIHDVPATHGWHLEAAYRSARCRVESAVAAGNHADAGDALSRAAEYEAELRQIGGVTAREGWSAARRALIDALRGAASGTAEPDELDEVAVRLNMLEPRGLGGGRVGGYRELLRALASAMRWRPAALAADPNPERFLRAAHERAATIQDGGYDEDLHRISAQIMTLDAYTEVPAIAEALASVPLPPTLSDLAPVRPRPAIRIPVPEPAQPPAVAIQVDIQAPQAGNASLLNPGAIATINVSASVPAWPAGAESLDVSFASTLTPAMLQISPITIPRDQTTVSGSIQITGHLALLARPAEITVNAAFRTGQSHEAARVLTNPTVRIVTTDPGFGLSNLPLAQERLRTILTELQVLHPAWAESEDARDTVLLLSALIRFSHHLTDETITATPEAMDEATFQRRLKEFLRADPGIGARLREAPQSGGGITDLVLGETVLELKVEPNDPVSPETATGHLAQPTTYASSRDRVVSILGILDESPKEPRQARGPIGDHLTWFTPATHGQSQQSHPAAVIAVILGRRFPRPSDLSR